jgi:hypothetical protein
VLSSLQRHLQQIYELESSHDVDDFLITDSEILRDLQGDENDREIDEKLLVRQDGDNVDIALYVDLAVVDRLSEDDPRLRLHEGNIADFCTALEGVSHFLYLTWNAAHERGVSLLELEMQAEVDKYVSTAFLFGQQASGYIPEDLHRWLFDDPVFDENLDRTSLERYRDANHYASRFCARLEERYSRNYRHAEMINELRSFYRLTQRAKISHINER